MTCLLGGIELLLTQVPTSFPRSLHQRYTLNEVRYSQIKYSPYIISRKNSTKKEISSPLSPKNYPISTSYKLPPDYPQKSEPEQLH